MGELLAGMQGYTHITAVAFCLQKIIRGVQGIICLYLTPVLPLMDIILLKHFFVS